MGWSCTPSLPLQVVALLGAVQLYALMLQSQARERGETVPSLIQALAATVSLPTPLFFLACVPLTASLAVTILTGQESGGIWPMALAAGLCYLIATGVMAVVAVVVQLGLGTAVRGGVVIQRR